MKLNTAKLKQKLKCVAINRAGAVIVVGDPSAIEIKDSGLFQRWTDDGIDMMVRFAEEMLEAELASARSALEHDRTKVAECVTAVTKELQSYDWLISSRGSYSWDDNRWHGEFKTAHDAIETAIQPMVKIAADWSNCPKSWDEVQKAREGEGQ